MRMVFALNLLPISKFLWSGAGLKKGGFCFRPRWRDNKSRVAATGCKSLWVCVCVCVCVCHSRPEGSSTRVWVRYSKWTKLIIVKNLTPSPFTLPYLQTSGVREFNSCAFSYTYYMYVYVCTVYIYKYKIYPSSLWSCPARQ
jgi:hypothetical protein